MGKLVKCKTCGAEIAKSAKTCPSCGAKQKKHTVLGIILVLIGVCLIAAAIGGKSGEPKKVNTSEAGGQTTSSDDQSIFHVGDTVNLNDVHVTLKNVSESNGSQFNTPTDGNVFVTFEFEIDNQSDSEIAVSSMMSFTAYFDDYAANISIGAMTDSSLSQLDGSVDAGKKMTGIVGYEAPDNWAVAEIRFTPDFWSGKEIVFEYAK